MPCVGGTGQPDFLVPILSVCRSWCGQLANRLEELESRLNHQTIRWKAGDNVPRMRVSSFCPLLSVLAEQFNPSHVHPRYAEVYALGWVSLLRTALAEIPVRLWDGGHRSEFA